MSLFSLLFTATVGLTSIAALFYFVLGKLVFRALGKTLRSRTAVKRGIVLSTLHEGSTDEGIIVGFFHPFCNAGGGGERVLWAAIRATQKKYPNAMCVVYTGDHDADKATILSRVENRFDIHLEPTRVLFLYLTTRHWIAASTWPHFTLLGQSLGSLVLAWDAFTLLVPDIFIDTMGYGFTLPFAKLLFGIPTGAYVHYPTISTDMLGSLPSGSTTSLRISAKRAYWKLFGALYSQCGTSIDTILCNSTWTATHLRYLWPSRASSITVVFPPCAVSAVADAIPLSKNGPGMAREKIILCIAQFRPEKKHDLIIDSFARYCASYPEDKETKLVLIGSVRHSEDKTRVYDLRLLAHEKGIKERVVFVCDASWPEILDWLARAWVGVNAMWNEHFGIGVVEYQAAGLISVVHDSGGPKLDIVVGEGSTGWHAETAEQFAEAYRKALELPVADVLAMRSRARESAQRFSEEVFADRWLVGLEELVALHMKRR
ncbi:hypothetical protein DFP73DRAFT_557907 [Morchella snyderi]|nr:hypothetical protein DFP73DRAFT_557907 [Morchella snyderi]